MNQFYRYVGAGVLALAIILFGGIYTFADQEPRQVPIVAVTAPDPMLSVVMIMRGEGHGSGVNIGRGYVITAAHVVDDAKQLRLKSPDGKFVDADVLWVNKTYDIAMLHTDAPPYDGPGAQLDCRDPQVGEDIRAAGNPINVEFVSSFGRIAGTARSLGPWKSVVVTDVTTVMGQSGGPVFEDDGRVIGITVGVMAAPIQPTPFGSDMSITGFGYMVPSSTVCMLMGHSA